MTVQNVFKVGEGLNKTLSFKNTIRPSNIGGFDWSCIKMRPIKVMGGVGNFRAAGILGGYQIPSMNSFRS